MVVYKILVVKVGLFGNIIGSRGKHVKTSLCKTTDRVKEELDLMGSDQVTMEDIIEAQSRLKDISYKTSLVFTNTFSDLSKNQVYLKTENLQKTGSFKIRGAFNKINLLTEKEKTGGVIASSAGNHAQGVALAATNHGIEATIVMPKHAPISKVVATKNYGAKVILYGNSYDEAYVKAREIQAETKATFIHAFNDPDIIAGQGTIGLEILEDLPDVDVIIVPVGGGGLISGISLAAKSLSPRVKIIGVQSKNNSSMINSLTQGKVTSTEGEATIADGIDVKTPGDITFNIVKKHVDDIVTVDEDEIANAILLLLERAKLTAEGAGATAIAALLHPLDQLRGKKVALVISGGNIDVNMLARIIDRGLLRSGRKIFLDAVIPDKPGTLSGLLKLVANTGANVLSVTHHWGAHDIPLGHVKIKLELETIDENHIEEIKSALETRHIFRD